MEYPELPYEWWPYENHGKTAEERTSLWSKWYASQRHAAELGAEIVPPWVAFPEGIEVAWAGWKQGYGESWRNRIWWPFWTRLSPEERIAYVERWNPPLEWREFLLGRWFTVTPEPVDRNVAPATLPKQSWKHRIKDWWNILSGHG